MVQKLFMVSIIFFSALSFTNELKGQTTIFIQYADDSLYSSHCPIPLMLPFQLSGQCSGYNYLTDSIEINVNFGDGSDTLFKVNIIPSFDIDYFSAYFFKHKYLFAGSYSVAYVATGPDGNADTLIHNDEVLAGDTCGNVSGLVFLDQNNNCIYDATDLAETYVPVLLYVNGNYEAWSYTDANGYYWFSVPNGLDCEIRLDTVAISSSGYASGCPLSAGYFITAPASGNNFGLVCNSITTSYDLWGGLNGPCNGVISFVPGNIRTIESFVSNRSCIPSNGIAKLILDDPNLIYISTTPPADSISGDTLMWNFNANNSNSFWAFWNNTVSATIVQIDSFAVIGDTICITLIIDPIAGDQNPSDNVFIFCDTVRSSYDPNYKSVMPAGIGLEGKIPPDTDLSYTIHFQNTGTAPATDIFILDTLDSDLDIPSFRPLMSSHPVTFDVLGNVVKFSFNNIMLPDSSSDEAASEGYVSYYIDQKPELESGTQIFNSAGIYFDFNPPIITNTTLNTIDLGIN
ncbi:MAG: hypothetical protein WBB36_07485, partial [Chitinophagales bacterium]